MVYETMSGALMKNVGYGDDGDGGGGGKDDHLLNDCLGLWRLFSRRELQRKC